MLQFRPDLSRSKSNATLARAAVGLPGVEVVDMAAGNPQGFELHHDGAREAARLLTADRIVLQFPVQWYSMPPQLKAWQDAVLKTGKQYIVVTAGAARQSPERGDYVIAYSLP